MWIGWGCILNCFTLQSLPCFPSFCWSAIPMSCYIFKLFFLILFMSLLAAGACAWAELCHHRAVCPHRLLQYMYAVLAEESLTRLSSNTKSTMDDRLPLSPCMHSNHILQWSHRVLQWLVWSALLFHATGGVIRHESTWRWMVGFL